MASHGHCQAAPVAQFLVALGGCLFAAPGCIVQSRCATDDDCASIEHCSPTGRCLVECEEDRDCWLNGVDYGKRCVDHRCDFLYDERVPAPNLCLEVVNPRSTQHGQELCLASLEGKVVQIYFGELF